MNAHLNKTIIVSEKAYSGLKTPVTDKVHYIAWVDIYDTLDNKVRNLP
jgi:hypothetical protein